MERRTQKQIKKEIEDLKFQISDNRNYIKHIPGYMESYNQLEELKNQYFKNIQSKNNELSTKIKKLNEELVKEKKRKELKLSDRVNDWFGNYENGIDWGYGGLKIIWLSEDENWAIITCKGATAGGGTAMGTGGYYYSPSTHWIADVRGGYNALRNKFMEIEGRLTKEKKKEMINYIKSRQ